MTKTRYNLEIPTETYKSLKRIAEEEGTTLAELLRKATKLFIYIRSIKQDPNARLLIERDGEIQEIVLELI